MAQDWNLPITSVSEGAAITDIIPKALETLRTGHSGGSEPTQTVPFMIWNDSVSGVVKRRNSTNTAWIILGPLEVSSARSSVMSQLGAPTAPLKARFVAPGRTKVLRVALVSDVTSVSDGTKYLSLQARNVTAAVDLYASAPTTTGDELVVDTPWRKDVDQNDLMNDGELLDVTLSATGNPGLTGADIWVQIDYELIG